jgi:hypothetical protein
MATAIRRELVGTGSQVRTQLPLYPIGLYYSRIDPHQVFRRATDLSFIFTLAKAISRPLY